MKTLRKVGEVESKITADRKLLVKACLKRGLTTKSEICESTGLTISQINNLFTEDRELYAEYVVERKTLVDVASDNLAGIVKDPKHPKHYEASKYVLQNYKSDFDEILESEGSMMQIEADPSRKAKSSVKIVFSKNDKKDD